MEVLVKETPCLSVSQQQDITILNVNLGEATLSDSGDFKLLLDSLVEENKSKIIVDFSSCRYIDSTFLGVVASHLKDYRIHSGDIKIVYSGSLVRAIFDVNGINRAIDTFENLDEAILSF